MQPFGMMLPPAIYMEVERSTSKMYIQSLYDDKYLYTHFIMADLDYKVPSKDLRDVVQYVDNANDKDKILKKLSRYVSCTKRCI